VACLGQRRKKYEEIDISSCKCSTLFAQRIVRNVTIVERPKFLPCLKRKGTLVKDKEKKNLKGKKNLKVKNARKFSKNQKQKPKMGRERRMRLCPSLLFVGFICVKYFKKVEILAL
jgi:hypothetical protein